MGHCSVTLNLSNNKFREVEILGCIKSDCPSSHFLSVIIQSLWFASGHHVWKQVWAEFLNRMGLNVFAQSQLSLTSRKVMFAEQRKNIWSPEELITQMTSGTGVNELVHMRCTFPLHFGGWNIALIVLTKCNHTHRSLKIPIRIHKVLEAGKQLLASCDHVPGNSTTLTHLLSHEFPSKAQNSSSA